MKYLIEKNLKQGFLDAEAQGAKHELNSPGTIIVSDVKIAKLFEIDGNINLKQCEKIAQEILCDNVSEDFSFKNVNFTGYKRAEIWLKNSITDVVGGTVEKIIKDIFYFDCRVRCGTAYFLKGTFNGEKLKATMLKTFVNPLIHKFYVK